MKNALVSAASIRIRAARNVNTSALCNRVVDGTRGFDQKFVNACGSLLIHRKLDFLPNPPDPPDLPYPSRHGFLSELA